jgi:hypothetical protein
MRRQLRRLVGCVGSALHLGDERVRRVLDLAHDTAGLPHQFGKLIGTEKQESQHRNDEDIGNGEHAGSFLPL